MYIFKGTDNVGTYAFLNEVVSIADLVAYRNVLIINLVSSRKQPCELPRAHTNNPPGPRNHSYEIGPLTISRAHGAQNSEARSSG